MFAEMLDAIETNRKPTEDFYDGYVVNSVIDACYKSAKTKKWEPVELNQWRGWKVALLLRFGKKK